MSDTGLTERQRELMKAFVSAWGANEPAPAQQLFILGSGPLRHPNWPTEVKAPSRAEVRSLHHLGLLEVDHRHDPNWAVFPSPDARAELGGGDETADALSDADRRLGVILTAAVEAHEGNPGEPIHLAVMDHVTMIDHSHWPIGRDVVKPHDLAQLEGLGLIQIAPVGDSVNFWPTAGGRTAIKNPGALLDERVQQAGSEEERSRLEGWAERLRASDFSVGTAAEVAGGMVIRALTGQ